MVNQLKEKMSELETDVDALKVYDINLEFQQYYIDCRLLMLSYMC